MTNSKVSSSEHSEPLSNERGPLDKMSLASESAAAGTPDRIHPPLLRDIEWFSDVVRGSIGDRLVSLTVYGPAVTKIYDSKEHRIHFLLVLDRCDVDALLRLAGHSKAAARRRIAPPLVTTVASLLASRDVFPLEWIDIEQFHHDLIGQSNLSTAGLDPANIRLQCERDLRSLEIQLLRGILASGGQAKLIDAVERESADTLIRVLRGIAWLSGDRLEHLPSDVCSTASAITGIKLTGCREAIASGGRHDLATLKMIVDEVTRLTAYVDGWKPGSGTSGRDSSSTVSSSTASSSDVRSVAQHSEGSDS